MIGGFEHIDLISFEGLKSKNLLAFKYVDVDRCVESTDNNSAWVRF